MSEVTRTPQRRKLARLVVPVALGVSTLGAIAAATGALAALSAGCGDDSPRSDGGPDAPPDTPIV